MSNTQEVYEHLTEIYGVSRSLCKHCMNRDVEVYQDSWEGCHYCWCVKCEPKITPPPE